MFKKWGADADDSAMESTEQKPEEHKKTEEHIVHHTNHKIEDKKMNNGSINTILKGSKLTGNIHVTCDLELSGDVEGNIVSEQDSNITIKGTCKGNIETKGGNVMIEGELRDGNITAGGDVRVSGDFNGGEVKAKGKIYVNGGFNGRLEADEIEIGSNAHGKGELFYKETISIAKGAKIEAQISQTQQELKLVKDTQEKKPEPVKAVEKAIKEDKEIKEMSKAK
jgi:cytoskeletal protein CcmA (bactofilin family)